MGKCPDAMLTLHPPNRFSVQYSWITSRQLLCRFVPASLKWMHIQHNGIGKFEMTVTCTARTRPWLLKKRMILVFNKDTAHPIFP